VSPRYPTAFDAMFPAAALPPDDPLRRVLHDEVHARPPIQLGTPERIAHVALRVPPEARAREEAAIADLAGRLGLPVPDVARGYCFLDGAAFRVKWERHTEFTSLTFFRKVGVADADARALDLVPPDWLATLPGHTIVAARVELRAGSAEDAGRTVAEFGDVAVVGASLGDGVATALTDFRIGPDGFSHFVVVDHGMSGRQAGRYVQRLLEIETYRMMALLAFPLAREVGPALTRAEGALAAITERTTRVSAEDEAALLDDLTRLAAEIERSEATSRFRFGAAQAYYRLVRQRIGELREQRIPGVQTIAEFMDRRLAPAMATCESTARRQEELSARIARASQLLRTRVDVALERQNQSLLESMDRRAKLQLRLQQTVEGLSIAAITYYAAGLVGYVGKAGKALGLPLDVDVAVAVAIPVIAFALWRGLRRLRHDAGS
jgi:uncharacterized membrane-anchored protein